MNSIVAPGWNEYEIIDSGRGKKLERFGTVTLIRPDRGARWEPVLSPGEWREIADGEFIEKKPGEGEWREYRPIPEEWPLSYPLDRMNVMFYLRTTRFKHVGVFPEQTVNWQHLFESCRTGERVLNLFAHTGGASMAASLGGAEVTHVDSVYSMVGWARQNSRATCTENIRWICEDSLTFVDKEIKRGNTYNRIIMDPPTYGFSKKGRQWKIERDLEPLMRKSASLLERGAEITLNCYSKRMEQELLTPLLKRVFPGQEINAARLYLKDRQGQKLNCGYLVRVRLT